jgi:hypothetical protein
VVVALERCHERRWPVMWLRVGIEPWEAWPFEELTTVLSRTFQLQYGVMRFVAVERCVLLRRFLVVEDVAADGNRF